MSLEIFNEGENTLYTYYSAEEKRHIETYSFSKALAETVPGLSFVHNNTYISVPNFPVLLNVKTDPISIIRALSLQAKVTILHKRRLLVPIHEMYCDSKCQVCHQKSCLLYRMPNDKTYQVCFDHLTHLTLLFEQVPNEDEETTAKRILQEWKSFEIFTFSFWPPEAMTKDLRTAELGQLAINQFKREQFELLSRISTEALKKHSKELNYPPWLCQTLGL